MQETKKIIFDNLLSFTGLSKDKLEFLLQRKSKTHIDEWNFWNPKTPEEILWYYRSSRAYLFTNAIHEIPKEIYNHIEKNNTILDFGGGAGTVSISLAQKSCNVTYYDIGILQSEFVKFVAKKEKLNISVCDDISLLNDSSHDFVIALDVIEHLIDYRKTINEISRILKPNGNLIIYAPFGKTEPSHFEDNYNLDNCCSELKLKRGKDIGICKMYVRIT